MVSHVSIWGGARTLFGEAKPTKAPRGDGTVFNSKIDSKAFTGTKQTFSSDWDMHRVTQKITVIT